MGILKKYNKKVQSGRGLKWLIEPDLLMNFRTGKNR